MIRSTPTVKRKLSRRPRYSQNMALEIGDTVGDYRIIGVLGRGGMGKVYRVRSLLTDRDEAMKIVLPDRDDDPAAADRFLREIRVHASLQHPNIATLHTALRVEGRIAMILELIEGASLEDLIRASALPIDDTVHYTFQVLSALGFAHERGVIHRDIKPANILIAQGGIAKLTDFGIARATGAARITGTGLAVGTLAFMSPEQIRSGHADARSDIYSLGLTVYEALTGRRAMQGPTEHAIMDAQLNEMPTDAAVVNANVPVTVSAAVMRAIAKDPAQRFQSAAEFQGALRGHLPVDFVPTKTVLASASQPGAAELADLEARLARSIGPIARRLVADASRRHTTLAEIREALSTEIQDPKARAEFLQGTSTSAQKFETAALDRLTEAVAPFIGPIAKVVVARAAKKAHTVEELHRALAEEIENPKDRETFRRRIGH